MHLSYIYLAAIGGLATLAATYPSATVHVISQRFAGLILFSLFFIIFKSIISAQTGISRSPAK